MKNNNHQLALEKWKTLYKFIPMLFEEPNPAPIKYCLNRLGNINSAEVILPLTEITTELKTSLKNVIFDK